MVLPILSVECNFPVVIREPVYIFGRLDELQNNLSSGFALFYLWLELFKHAYKMTKCVLNVPEFQKTVSFYCHGLSPI